jgi:hypothetical protein
MTDHPTAATITGPQLAELYARLNQAETIARWYAEAESADVAAGSYAGRVEELQTTLAAVLAWLHPITRAMDGSVIAYQTVNGIPPATYDRWQAALQPPTPAPPVPCPACTRAEQAGLAADDQHPDCRTQEQP